MSKTLRWGIFSVCIIVMAVCGFEMYVATEMQKLWGWLTLPFLLAFWAFFVFLRLPKYNLRWLGLSTLSGILLALGFPVSPFTFLMFVGFVPLMIVQADILKIQTIPNITRKPNIMGYAYNAIVIWNIITTFWVCNAGLIAGMIAIFLNAFFQSLTFWLAHKTAVQLRGGTVFSKIPVGAFTIAFWMAFEYLHLNWELSWTWLTLGNAFAQYPDWVQWYEYTGVFGGSLWILLVNSLIFIFLNKNNNTIRVFKNPIYLLKIAASIFIPLSISYLILFLNKKNEGAENGKSYKIVIVQPNYEPHYEKFDIPEAVQITKFIRLAQTAVDSTTDYLVFPETSFDFHNVNHWRERPIVQELQEFVNKYPKLHLVLGVDALKIYAQYSRTKPENMPSTVREYNNRDGSYTYFEVYNAATQMISGDSMSPLPLYKKSKLVPGPEILPYKFLLGWLKPLFDKFGGTVGGLGMQEERSVFTNKDSQFSVGPVICYESIFGDYCRGYVKNGANALFVVTNDGWWDDTPGYRQHKAFASLRAIELRRPVIRSANTGTSCFVDVNGHISQATDYAKDAIIKGSIGVYNKQTFYVKTGDIIGVLASIATIISLILFLFKKITTNRTMGI